MMQIFHSDLYTVYIYIYIYIKSVTERAYKHDKEKKDRDKNLSLTMGQDIHTHLDKDLFSLTHTHTLKLTYTHSRIQYLTPHTYTPQRQANQTHQLYIYYTTLGFHVRYLSIAIIGTTNFQKNF